MKKLLLLALALVVVTAGATFMMNKKRADMARDFISALPGDLRAENVKADFFGSGLEVHGLSGTLAYSSDLPLGLKVGRLRLEGLNTSAGRSGGQEKLADRVILNDFIVTFPEGPGNPLGYEEYSMEEARFNGVWADVAAFAAARGSAANSPEQMRAMLSLRFGKSEYKNSLLRANLGPLLEELDLGSEEMRFTFKSPFAESESHSLTEMGAMRVRDASIDFTGGTRAVMKEISVKEGRVPAEVLLSGVLDPQKAIDPDKSEEFLALLAEGGYALKDLAFKDFTLTFADGESLSAAAASFTMILNNKELRLNLTTGQAAIPATLLGRLSGEPEAFANVLADRVFLFDSEQELLFLAAENNVLDMSYRERISEKELGSVKDEIRLFGKQGAGALKILPDDFMTLVLKGFELRLEDKGFIDLAFELAGADLARHAGDGTDARTAGERLRTQQIEDIKALPLAAGSPLADLRDAVAALLGQQGVLTVICAPEQPLPVLPLLLEPSGVMNLPFRSEFVPAGATQ